MKDTGSKELFDFIRSADIKNLPPLKSILSSYSIPKYSSSEVLAKLYNNKENILLIDARSEKEFEETSLPYSLNFPVLNNSERHNTGLIYKKYSQTSALWLAMHYADPKSDSFKDFLEKNDAAKKEIMIYCWRGGGRSGYLSKMAGDLGYKISTVVGGYKSFRKEVVDFFSKQPFPYDLLELSGLTGCGKTELLTNVSKVIPAIDLEGAARHFSSLLGKIPYDINNVSPVKTQTEFENNLFGNIYFNLFRREGTTFLIESESKRVGNFEIPNALFDKMQISPSVKIISSIESRVARIVRDYFGEDLRGIEPMKNIFNTRQAFFKQQLSNKTFNELIDLLDAGRVNEFTEIMIKEYYDRKYKDKGKTPLAEISTDNIKTAGEELINVYKNKFQITLS